MVGGKSLLLVIPQLLRTNEATKSSKALTIHAKINQGLIFKNQLFLATSRGLGLYHPDKDPITFGDPTLSLASAKINGANLSNGDQLPWDEYTLNLAFTFEEMGVDSNITLNYVLDGKEFSVKGSTITIPELEHGQHNLTISAINDKGVKTVNETGLEFSIENPAIDRIINYIIIGAIILAYSLMLIFIIRKKFKKDIRVLEDALLEKTNRLNQLERGKYGLVEEEKVKLK